MEGSRDSYAPQVHNLYPCPQPRVYPPPPPPNPQGYQTYLGDDYAGPYGWSEQQRRPPAPAAAPPSQEPFHYGYQDDADCITFLRGCFAGLCCCCLLEQCCL